MIGEDHLNARPYTAASAINPNTPVKFNTGNTKREVLAAASNNDEIAGFTGDATALQGEAVTVYGTDDWVTAVAGASLGAGPVAIASANGALGPAAQASGVSRRRVGISLEPAAAGEKFTVYVRPELLSDNA